ncbi:C40 family peptidase [Tomitella cavernea]|uniref:C40 family peptidase n=1 Tax=Tomitella cavernea TaxID=1387982 RepID=A0ABP9CZ59_9ACTN|nr:C40 family peptidase [Tomitella cavernea]
MAKHRLKKQSALGTTTRSALAIGAVSAGTIGLVAAPAAADTVTVQGIGTFDVPEGVTLPEIPTTDAMLSQAPAGFTLPEGIDLPEILVDRGAGDSLGDSSTGDSLGSLQDSVGSRALAAAESKVGSPYVWGANGPNAFDCSGLIQWSYAQAGVQLPRTSYDQAAAGHAVSLSDLQPGDIVIYAGGGHAALYVGGGQIVHATTSGVPVKYADLNVMNAVGARRI